MTAVNLWITDNYAAKNSQVMINKTCEAQSLKIDGQLQLVEQAVDNIYQISEGVRPTANEMQSAWRVRLFMHEFQSTALRIAENTEGAMAVYYRVAPDLTTNKNLGFFCVKNAETGEFEETELTDITKFDPTDDEHVGWYYKPVLAGKALWLDKYYNANIDKDMISYVVPVYDGEVLIGVIGMDVDFTRLLSMVEDVDIYETSGAVLASMDNSNIYYEKCKVLGDALSESIYEVLKSNDKSDSLISCDTDFGIYQFEYITLRNNMKLIVYANNAEISRQQITTMCACSCIVIVFLIINIFTSTRFTRKITEPIMKITGAAKSFAEGDWDAIVGCNTNDELQILSNNMEIMARKTKEYIEYINNMAMKDELTGLRNKTAYKQYVDKINIEYAGTDRDYAVLVCDVNNLKLINDNYGHEEGDKLIIAASRVICKTFAHSPVFRIGGDEFVVIIDSEDYGNKDKLLSDFKEQMYNTPSVSNADNPSVAIGMAVYKADGRDFEELFATADMNMYTNKMELKNENPR
ncbi:MAG: diguanylate cyclase [Pseudobutyrivibrio sp.]|nr:diguanylate cyclase [Pseudobutyrivibrio sp.]